MRSVKSEMPSRTQILARKATTAGMRRPGVAEDRRPGQRDTTRVHQAGAQAHAAGNRPDGALIGAMSRRRDVHSAEKAENKAACTEKE